MNTFDFIFPREYLRAALMVSLLSVWVLVGLFIYLNRYTKREYFTVWTAAWLFYALWLTLGLQFGGPTKAGLGYTLMQFCVAISAVFLLWGSLVFVGLKVRQSLFGLFLLFLLVWTWVGPQVVSDMLQVEMPVFILLGAGSCFAGACFYRLRRKMPFVGAGMLTLGFNLWGLYLAAYPLSEQFEHLHSAGFFLAAVLQLFIAVSMIVLVLEEVRYRHEQTIEEIARVKEEKEALLVKMLTTEEKCRALYDKVRLTKGAQEAYDELRHTQQVVVQQERLRALGQMASGIAHDINNALSPVLAYSDLLLGMQPKSNDASYRYLQNIYRSAEDIAQIVARMREFYRPRGDHEPLVELNVNQTIEEVIDLTRPRWRDLAQRQGQDIKIQRDFQQDLPRLTSDASELREALTNLIFNAVDAMPQGGTIVLASRSTVMPSKDSNTTHTLAGVEVEVRDDGLGMSEKTRQRCLEPFFSTKAQRGGTGLGLAMVYGMMQRHDGVVQIDSSEGRGTSIRLIFPIRKTKHKAATEPPKVAEVNRSLRVLCIDDEPMVCRLLNDCLIRFNHQVTVAPGGRQGLEMFRAALRDKQPFQVVVTDLGMPDVDGQQVARSIKSESPSTPVILLTGWGTMMKDEGDEPVLVDAVVSKPPRIPELNQLLLKMASASTSQY